MELGYNLITAENLKLIGFKEITKNGVKIYQRGKSKLQIIKGGLYELNAESDISIGEIGQEISDRLNSN